MYILSLKKVEITEQFRILHDEELGYLCRSHNVVRIVKCRRVRWAGHVAGMKGGGGQGMNVEYCSGNLLQNVHLEHKGYGKIISTWVLVR